MADFGGCKIVLRREQPLGFVVEYDLHKQLVLNKYYYDNSKSYERDTEIIFNSEYDLLFKNGILRTPEEIVEVLYAETECEGELQIDEVFVAFYLSVSKSYKRRNNE